MNYCFFTAVCEEDAVWIPQYLDEMHRLQSSFAMHFDRCSAATKALVLGDVLLVGHTAQDNPEIGFDELQKQPILTAVCDLGRFDWAIAMDIDETWEREAPQKFFDFDSQASNLRFRWHNLWGDRHHIRVDGPLQSGQRTSGYNLRRHEWLFKSAVVNGAYAVTGGEPDVEWTDIVCLHHGMMTKELRDQHKARWDAIYKRVADGNPYGYWAWACDESITPIIVENTF